MWRLRTNPRTTPNTMSNFLLDPTTNQLDLTKGKLKLVIVPADEIRQKIAVRLRFFQGEWFLDQTIGIPYFQQILIKNPRLPIIQSIYRAAIVTVPGVADIKDFVFSFDSPTRKLSLSFRVLTDTSQVLNFNQTFVIGSSP